MNSISTTPVIPWLRVALRALCLFGALFAIAACDDDKVPLVPPKAASPSSTAETNAAFDGVLLGRITTESGELFQSNCEPTGSILGLRCSYASKFLRDRYNLPPGKGCVVLRVVEDSAAERAGFQIGDKIVGMDGVPITSGRQFSFLFEGMPGPACRTFTVERGQEKKNLYVQLGTRGRQPENDPYFYYLRAKSEAASGSHLPQIAADFTEAIELEPEFDLAYLYRGEFKADSNYAAAEADLRKALELDPDLTEASRYLAQLLRRRGDIEGALEQINRSIELNGCSGKIEQWDIDCGEDVAIRSWLYVLRLQPGDDLLIQADTDAIEDVTFMEPAVVLNRFELAYVRGHDELMRERAQGALNTSFEPLYPGFKGKWGEIDLMLRARTSVPLYTLSDWFNYNRLAGPTGDQAGNLYQPGSFGARPADSTYPVLYYQISIPGLKTGENVAWELRRGDYRILSGEEVNPFGGLFGIQLSAWREVPPGSYVLQVYVDGKEELSTTLEVP